MQAEKVNKYHIVEPKGKEQNIRTKVKACKKETQYKKVSDRRDKRKREERK